MQHIVAAPFAPKMLGWMINVQENIVDVFSLSIWPLLHTRKYVPYGCPYFTLEKIAEIAAAKNVPYGCAPWKKISLRSANLFYFLQEKSYDPTEILKVSPENLRGCKKTPFFYSPGSQSNDLAWNVQDWRYTCENKYTSGVLEMSRKSQNIKETPKISRRVLFAFLVKCKWYFQYGFKLGSKTQTSAEAREGPHIHMSETTPINKYTPWSTLVEAAILQAS